MEISKLVNAAHSAAIDKGFYPEGEDRNIGELLMLIVSELGEALEAHRKSRIVKENTGGINLYDTPSDWESPELWRFNFEKDIKDSFEDEIADTVIRIADLCGYMDIDLESHIIAKMRYNETRPAKHGKAY
jgi:NTP pyrophosphatase (non-canonical NTP hydrolase)